MHAVKGTYRNGQIVLSQRANWPDGTEVLVEPVSQEHTAGLRDEDWPTDPEGIARHLALMDRTEPFDMTPQEEAEWQAARKAQKEHDLANWEGHAGRAERLFE